MKTVESFEMYVICGLREEGGMNELTCPAFTLACGGVRCVPRTIFEGGGDVRNATQIRDSWHVNAEGREN